MTAADLVETSFLMMGLLCAREYFDRDTPEEAAARVANLDPLERGRVELVHARRARRALLALEPVQRLGHGSRDSRLERVPHHVRACGLVAALFRRAGGLSPRLRERARISQSQILVWHRATPRHGLWRPAVLHPLLVLRPRSPRAHGPIRRLLGTERASRSHQPGPLRRESGQIRGLRRILLGADGQRRSVRGTPRMLPTTTTARSARRPRSRACRMRPPRS